MTAVSGFISRTTAEMMGVFCAEVVTRTTTPFAIVVED